MQGRAQTSNAAPTVSVPEEAAHRPSTSSDHIQADRPKRDAAMAPTIALYFAEEFAKIEQQLASGRRRTNDGNSAPEPLVRPFRTPSPRLNSQHASFDTRLTSDKTFLLYTSEAYLVLD